MRNACILLIDHDPGETGFVRTSLNKAGILNELVVVDYYKGEFILRSLKPLMPARICIRLQRWYCSVSR